MTDHHHHQHTTTEGTATMARADRSFATPTPEDAAFGAAIREVRESKGMRLEDAARQLANYGVKASPATVGRIETAVRAATPKEGLAMLAMYGLRPGVVVGTSRWKAGAPLLALELDPTPAAPAEAAQAAAGPAALDRLADAVEELVSLMRAAWAPEGEVAPVVPLPHRDHA